MPEASGECTLYEGVIRFKALGEAMRWVERKMGYQLVFNCEIRRAGPSRDLVEVRVRFVNRHDAIRMEKKALWEKQKLMN